MRKDLGQFHTMGFQGIFAIVSRAAFMQQAIQIVHQTQKYIDPSSGGQSGLPAERGPGVLTQPAQESRMGCAGMTFHRVERVMNFRDDSKKESTNTIKKIEHYTPGEINFLL